MTRRPILHFTPERHWMNDPNGLVFHKGRYHLYFQHNPWGSDHANMSWGHASSTDLVTWTEHPVAIAADEHEQVFSGSVVIDHDDTAGFGAPGRTALVAVYTSVSAVTGIQSQALAFSRDDGLSWTKYAGNPVLDRGSLDFRDPKVFRYDGPAGAYWVMVAVEATERRVLLYRSDDLKHWTFLSDYGPAGAVGGVWECPDLFPLAVDDDADDVRWVLLISLNPGGLAGGSGTQYVVGRFDGVRFTPDEQRLPVRASGLDGLDWIDHGRDCYAGVTFHGLPDDDRILIAWMSNWDYARGLRPARWQGAMTTARGLGLTRRSGRIELTSRPVLPAGEPVEIDPDAGAVGAAGLVLPAAARIDVRVRGDVVLELGTAQGPTVTLRCGPDEILLDRRDVSGVHAEFPSIERVRLPARGREVGILIDTASIEVYAADGLRTITDVVPWTGDVILRVRERGGLERLAVTDLSAPPAPVLVIGESLIDVVDRAGSGTRHVGGSPLNVAYGLGRLGIPTVFATEFGDDHDGAAIAEHLGSAGVAVLQTSGMAGGGRTARAIARLGDDGAVDYEFDLDWRFDRTPDAPRPAAVHIGSIGALRSPGGEGVLAFVEQLPREILVSFDPNIRPTTVPPRAQTRRLVERYAARAAVVKLSEEDARWLYPGEDDTVAGRLLACGARLVAITRGAGGSDLHTPSAHLHVPVQPASIVDTIGAGDAYAAGLLSAIVTGVGTRAVQDDALTEADLAHIGRFAAVAAALTVGRAGAVPPTAGELRRELRRQSAAVAG